MTILQKLLEEEENTVFCNQESFLTNLACSPNDIMDLTSVSFSSERVHFNYVFNSGQHVADSCTMSDYLKWKETL